jgi:hypothetical protein
VACHHTSGSVSAKRGAGVWKGYWGLLVAKTSPIGLTKRALIEEVPTSIPIKFISNFQKHLLALGNWNESNLAEDPRTPLARNDDRVQSSRASH